MNINDDMAHNAVLMKRCQKIYNRITIIYASICIPYALSQTFVGFLFYNRLNPVFLISDVFCKTALLVCGFLSCYKHENKFALSAFLIQLINTLIGSEQSTFLDIFFNTVIAGFNFNYGMFFIVIILSCLTVYANKQYQYLTEQFGFPYFNERIEEQNFDRRQAEIKDEFQQNYERYKKNSSNSMIDIDLNYRSGDMGKYNSCQSGTIDDIMEDYNE